jgi:hypothetical protein
MRIIFIIIFYALAFVLYSYANGNWENLVKDKAKYNDWQITNSKKVKKGIFYFIIVYTIGTLLEFLPI